MQLVPGLFGFELHLLELCPVSHTFGVITLLGFTEIGFNLKENKKQWSQLEEFLASCWSFCLRNEPKDCLENTRLKTQNNCETEEKQY